jgi:hypothetical protein
MCRYVDVSDLVCDSLFGLFLVSWFITRHVLFTLVIISTYTDLPRVAGVEWAPERGRFLSREYWIIFCACLTALQVRMHENLAWCIADLFQNCTADHPNCVVWNDMPRCMEGYHRWKGLRRPQR